MVVWGVVVGSVAQHFLARQPLFNHNVCTGRVFTLSVTMMSVAGQPRCLAASGIQVRPQPCFVDRAAGAASRRSSPAACPASFARRVRYSHAQYLGIPACGQTRWLARTGRSLVFDLAPARHSTHRDSASCVSCCCTDAGACTRI